MSCRLGDHWVVEVVDLVVLFDLVGLAATGDLAVLAVLAAVDHCYLQSEQAVAVAWTLGRVEWLVQEPREPKLDCC